MTCGPVGHHDHSAGCLETLVCGRALSASRAATAPSSRCRRAFQATTDTVWAVVFAPDGRTLATGGDRTVILLDRGASMPPVSATRTPAQAVDPSGRPSRLLTDPSTGCCDLRNALPVSAAVVAGMPRRGSSPWPSDRRVVVTSVAVWPSSAVATGRGLASVRRHRRVRGSCRIVASSGRGYR
jgi:WD40 repeat protein